MTHPLTETERRHRRAVIMEHSRAEAARILGLSLSTVQRMRAMLDLPARDAVETRKAPPKRELTANAESFIAVWNSSDSVAEVAELTGMDSRHASQYASRLRKRGARLQLFASGRK